MNAGHADTATKATQDASGNVITSTYETKTSATAKLETAKSYTDTAISNVQVQLDTKAASSALNNYYTKAEIDNMEFITVDDIDAICGTTISFISLTDGGF